MQVIGAIGKIGYIELYRATTGRRTAQEVAKPVVQTDFPDRGAIAALVIIISIEFNIQNAGSRIRINCKPARVATSAATLYYTGNSVPVC